MLGKGSELGGEGVEKGVVGGGVGFSCFNEAYFMECKGSGEF